MNRLYNTYCGFLVIFLCLLVGNGYGQKQIKKYHENFDVAENTILNINTSHADIQFETWDRDRVEIEAVVELEGATKEEADAYFKNDVVRIVGNSKEISVSTTNSFSWGFNHVGESFNDFHIEIPDIPNLEPLFLDLEIPELPEIPEIPPMPPMPTYNFDYDRYKEDGDKYLDEWKEEFEENFNEEYRQRIEEWSERVEARAEERKERMKEHKERMEERIEEREERNRERKELRKEREQMMKEQRQVVREQRNVHRNVIISHEGDEPNIFYWSSDGENKNYKVKKTIKIKMPKSVKLKMNVRHGEVKLAQNTKNIDATLSHARLLAYTIDGDRTSIMASYSPVSVQNWNYGKLRTDYSDNVVLKQVKNLRLNAISSMVNIEHLTDKVHINNNLGSLNINSISNNFTDLNILVSNGELNCNLPTSDFAIIINSNNSQIDYPSTLTMNVSKKHAGVVHTGYHNQKNQKREILIDAEYSEVVLER
ncbi:hypothetical protein [Spongiimicrobium sp. 3-5]|uniref:hypothetical protein n=1 Tax=Spongiimicrobium sp. 3-5 TaxID=3332596 RepID=UPI00397FBE3E